MLRRPEAALFAMALGCYAYFFQGGGWNQNSRFNLVRSIVEQHTIVVDDYVHNTGDIALRDGHYYCDKAPGVSILAVPVYAAVHPFAGGQRPRGRLVNAAKAAGLQAWDVPHIDLGRPDDLSEETRKVLALGFSCKTAIHPQQIPIIHAALAPSPDELAWAKALLQAIPDGPTEGAFIFEGRMVDAPVLRKARRIVELSDR